MLKKRPRGPHQRALLFLKFAAQLAQIETRFLICCVARYKVRCMTNLPLDLKMDILAKNILQAQAVVVLAMKVYFKERSHLAVPCLGLRRDTQLPALNRDPQSRFQQKTFLDRSIAGGRRFIVLIFIDVRPDIFFRDTVCGDLKSQESDKLVDLGQSFLRKG